MRKYFLFDCECGDANDKSSLLTLFGAILNEKLNVQDTISLAVKPNDGVYHVTAGGMGVNKIDLIEHDKVAVTVDEASKEFEDFICKHSLDDSRLIPAGHNLSLDVGLCKKNLLQEKSDNRGNSGGNWENYFSYRNVDTASIAQALVLAGKLPADLSCSLGSLAEHFGFSYDGAHNAEFDVMLTLKVLKALIKLM